MRSILICLMTIIIASQAARAQTGVDDREHVRVDLQELCHSWFVMSPSNGWAMKASCKLGGMPRLIAVGEAEQIPDPDVDSIAELNSVIYQENARFIVNVAELLEPLEINEKNISLSVSTNAEFAKVKSANEIRYCWFDVRELTDVEIADARFARMGIFGAPLYEAVCLDDKDEDGVAEAVYHRKFGTTKFTALSVKNAPYHEVTKLVLPTAPSGFPGAETGAPFLTRKLKLDEILNAFITLTTSGFGDGVVYIPHENGIGERDYQGLTIKVQSVSENSVGYSITGAFTPWVEFEY